MKRKPPLVLMEQMVMLLVFALAAALCLQAFVKSDSISRRSEARDRAAALCQSTAEVLRSSGGSAGGAVRAAAEALGFGCEQAVLCQEFDGDWNPAPQGVYRLEAEEIPAGVPGLQAARVRVTQSGGAGEEPDVLFEIAVAWQEVNGGGV